jgi:two-component system phosphate regulon sensor histidine kinase PhoR
MSKIFTGMKKRLRYIFFIAALTAGGIIICQLYWVYFNYQTARTNFIQTATVSLWQSVDSCLLAQNALPSSLNEEKPSLTFMMTRSANLDSSGRDSSHRPPGPTFSVELFTVGLDEDQVPGVKTLVARLFSQRAKKPLNLDTLSRFFQQELLRNGIKDAFDLTIEKNKKKILPGQIAAMVNFNKEPAIVKAELKNRSAFFFRMNFVPALVSTLLILLSAGSLFYMGRIIKRQMQLDTMKTDFTNNIIHELRTPLTILRSSNEAMASFGAAYDEGSLMRYLGINTLVIDDLDKNIERILDFSRSEQGKRLPVLETIDLLPVLHQVQLRFSQVNNASITIITDEEPFEVVTDPFMLGIILSNLVDNAIKYSPQEAKIGVYAGRDGQSWQLQVSDQGMGIPGSSLPYIFDKFYRVPTGDVHEIKGYGIGLAYVKQLVTDLKGKIEVASEPGQGTVFTITFYS